MSKFKQATVAELIEMLKEMPQDALVCTEGCDCYGDVYKPIIKDGQVMIIRTDDRLAYEESKRVKS